MKTLRIFSVAFLLMAFATVSFAQSKTETFKVSGNCGMCKSKIEKAAKEAGAKTAIWDMDTKILTVTYTSSSTNTAKIQEKIASVGYDNAGATASKESYDKLHGCCKYERTAVNKIESCCKDGKCDKQACKDAGCCHDGKCDMSICSEKGCCKDGAMNCGANNKGNSAKGEKSCCSKKEVVKE